MNESNHGSDGITALLGRIGRLFASPVKDLGRGKRTIKVQEGGSYRLLVLGVRGRPSYQVRIPRGEGRWWARPGGALTNSVPVPLPGRTKSTRWVLLDHEGRMLAEGRFGRPVDGAEVQTGKLAVFLGVQP